MDLDVSVPPFWLRTPELIASPSSLALSELVLVRSKDGRKSDTFLICLLAEITIQKEATTMSTS